MRLTWDDIGSRHYDAGIDRGVFYPSDGPGVAWNGLTAINETVANADSSVIYLDGLKQVNQLGLGDFAATIEAFTYPDEFMPYDGYSEPMFTGQARPQFNLSYRTQMFHDTTGESVGYRLHLVYNCLVKPTTRNLPTLNDGVDISAFSWDLSTVPLALPYDRPTAHLYLESTGVELNALTAIESIIYGSADDDPRIPGMGELLGIFESNAIFTVIDNGDGTATVIGPDDWVYPDPTDPTLWTLTSPSVYPLSDILYKTSSY